MKLISTDILSNIGSGSPKQAIFGKLKVAPAYRVVFDTIEKLIMSGKLSPGDTLPTETELAEQFNINRSTLREGIRLLEQNGLVVRGAAKRLTISAPQIVDIASRTSRALILHDVTFRELWETYMILEPALAKLAAANANANAKTIAELEGNLDQMIKSSDDADRFFELDNQFHSLIAEAANNRPLLLAREPISILMMPAAHAILPRLNTYDRVIQAHTHILDAIRTNDEKKAQEWMRKHTADFQRGYLSLGFTADERLVDFGVQTNAEPTPL
jgi:DNA-binding FadR family transcriptional regulator